MLRPVQRGLFSTEEVHWLLAWVGDAKAPELQEKSAIALADYIKEEKFVSFSSPINTINTISQSSQKTTSSDRYFSCPDL